MVGGSHSEKLLTLQWFVLQVNGVDFKQALCLCNSLQSHQILCAMLWNPNMNMYGIRNLQLCSILGTQWAQSKTLLFTQAAWLGSEDYSVSWGVCSKQNTGISHTLTTRTAPKPLEPVCKPHHQLKQPTKCSEGSHSRKAEHQFLTAPASEAERLSGASGDYSLSKPS